MKFNLNLQKKTKCRPRISSPCFGAARTTTRSKPRKTKVRKTDDETRKETEELALRLIKPMFQILIVLAIMVLVDNLLFYGSILDRAGALAEVAQTKAWDLFDHALKGAVHPILLIKEGGWSTSILLTMPLIAGFIVWNRQPLCLIRPKAHLMAIPFNATTAGLAAFLDGFRWERFIYTTLFAHIALTLAFLILAVMLIFVLFIATKELVLKPAAVILGIEDTDW